MALIQLQFGQAHRIKMENLRRAGVILDEDRFESALKQVASTIVLPVEPHAVTDVGPLHGAAQVGFWSLGWAFKG